MDLGLNIGWIPQSIATLLGHLMIDIDKSLDFGVHIFRQTQI